MLTSFPIWLLVFTGVSLAEELSENKPKSLLSRNPGRYPSSQQSDPEDFSEDEASPPQHHPAHFPVHSPNFLISTSLGTADTSTSTIPALSCVTARSTALQVAGNCDRFQ